MNELLRPATLPATTQAAQGLQRRRFSVAEVESMGANGIIAEDERVELIGGEVVPMSPKGRRHEILRTELAFRMAQQAGPHLRVAAEVQFNLTEDTYVVPDILVYPAGTKAPDVRGPSALLVVEVAESSLAYDLGTKAALYAGCGLREYWVIDARGLTTRIHRGPAGSAYSDVQEFQAEALLAPQSAPELAVRLQDLDVD